MNRLIVLDSGPLGMVTNPKAKGIPLNCQLWLKSLLQKGEKIVISRRSQLFIKWNHCKPLPSLEGIL
jgi:hypothetical protein